MCYMVVYRRKVRGDSATQTVSLYGGAERDRTAGLLVANEALSQLSYSPTTFLSYQRAANRERRPAFSSSTSFRRTVLLAETGNHEEHETA